MSTATAVAQRSPAGAAATSPGYQGSSPPATQPTERPASAEMERQAAPASEPTTIKEVEGNPDAAVEGEANAGANKACEDEDATPSKEVRKKRTASTHCCCFFGGRGPLSWLLRTGRALCTTAMDRQDISRCGWLQMTGTACIHGPRWPRLEAPRDLAADRRGARPLFFVAF